MGGPTQPATAPDRKVDEAAGGPAGARRLSRERLGEEPADYLRRVEVRKLPIGEVASRAHRARLDRDRVSHLANKADAFLGVAVAYEPGFGYVLIGGEHRFAAAVLRGERYVKVYVLRSWRDMQAWMGWDLEQNKIYSWAPWNAAEAAWFMDKALPLLTVTRHDGAAEDVAEYTGVPRASLDNARYATTVWEDTNESDELRSYAAAQLNEIVDGKASGSSIRDKIKRERQRIADRNKPRPSLTKQRAMLAEALSTLEGLADGLGHLGEPSDEFDMAELETTAAAMGKAIARITRVKNTLRRGK